MSTITKGMRVAFGRRFGASPEARERMDAANKAALWVGVCRKCKTTYKGSLEAIRDGTAHKCGPPDENSQ